VIVAARYAELTLSAPVVVVLLVASLVAAHASYVYVEQPARAPRTSASPIRSLTLAFALCSVLAAISGVVIGARGFPQRMPAKVAFNDGLALNFNRTNHCRPFPYCAIGASKPRKVVFMGDSHTSRLDDALQSINAQHPDARHQALLLKRPGCIPIRGISSPGARHCAGFTEQSFVRAQQPDVDSVVLAARWTLYLLGKLQQGAKPQGCRMHGDDCEPFATPEVALATAKQHMTQDVKMLLDRGKRVYLMLPVPGYERSVPDYLARRDWLGTSAHLDSTRKLHEQRTARVSAMLTDVAHSTGARLLDPADAICPGVDCLIEHDGWSLYMDDNHVSGRGSLLLVPLLRPLML
jgi:SGNH domain-containing protein